MLVSGCKGPFVLLTHHHGQHLVIYDGAQVAPVNMETTRPHPSPSEVEEVLRAANVPLLQ
jgi:hypothetical protein